MRISYILMDSAGEEYQAGWRSWYTSDAWRVLAWKMWELWCNINFATPTNFILFFKFEHFGCSCRHISDRIQPSQYSPQTIRWTCSTFWRSRGSRHGSFRPLNSVSSLLRNRNRTKPSISVHVFAEPIPIIWRQCELEIIGRSAGWWGWRRWWGGGGWWRGRGGGISFAIF